MNLESLEDQLRRYEPVAPPEGFRERLLSAARARERRRHWRFRALLAAAALLLAAGVMDCLADRAYEEAVRLANSKQPPPADGDRTAIASVLSVQLPGARALLLQNGDRHE